MESITGWNQGRCWAFAVCYLTAHYVLDLIDEQQASAALDYCEENIGEV